MIPSRDLRRDICLVYVSFLRRVRTLSHPSISNIVHQVVLLSSRVGMVHGPHFVIVGMHSTHHLSLLEAEPGLGCRLTRAIPDLSHHHPSKMRHDIDASIKHPSPISHFPSPRSFSTLFRVKKLTLTSFETSPSRHRYLQQSNVNPKLLRQRHL